MSQLKDIKERIESIKKTRKMTQAMKMVAAAKFKRLVHQAVSSRAMVKSVNSSISLVAHQTDGLIDNDLMIPVDSTKELILLITGDRGLCGGFNTNLHKALKTYISKCEKTVELIIFGRKGVQSFKRSGLTIVKTFENFQDKFDLSKVEPVVDEISELYQSNAYSSITVFYSEFKTAVSSNLVNKQLFPVPYTEFVDENTEANILIEPSETEVLRVLCKQFVQFSLYSAFLESSAAEQGARMAAMDSATDNARDMIGDLTLVYNRQRQAQITTELTEIVAGAEALVG
jgi:F-type H+-transporting ATPase subunit gamma